MKKNLILFLTKSLFFAFLITPFLVVNAQEDASIKTKNPFWENVQFGGGLGLGFGSNFTNITVAPSGIYNFNEYFSAGLGLQYSYVKQKGYYQSNIYGGSIIALFNPIREIQISTEIEQLRVNSKYDGFYGNFNDDFWNTALFIGAGYRTNNVTLGVRYNVLHKDNDGVYADALIPFVRVYF
ncbi:hypothetical protein LXD69_06745 [Flavobacterium sediminilitoris]|uniref:Alpha-ketoglutarate decarboxylase n=1 Tax=Flavobacterium sediminilitoris TaxID=2024526 RepID=A0ABY4HSB2_9FLAO|nr:MULTISPECIES: hypothetical protein [Flavobacterium]UOX35207.1 hypothetical protein LXD69_06745 [Flavobacterium sediminilitoris]